MRMLVRILGSVVFLLSSHIGFAAGMDHGAAGPNPITTLIKSPNVPFRYALGLRDFRSKCSSCHGQWAEGVAKTGPPLVHRFYEPSHHADAAFYSAAKNGSKQHHWNFGDMPPVADISQKQIANITQFIRWWQQQNSIQ